MADNAVVCVSVTRLSLYVDNQTLAGFIGGVVLEVEEKNTGSAFAIVVDGSVDANCAAHIGTDEAGYVTSFLARRLVEKTRILLFTDVTPDTVRFLCLFYGQLRSAVHLTILLDSVCSDSELTGSQKDEKLSNWWLSTTTSADAEVESPSDRVWADIKLSSEESSLPSIVMSSPSVRLLRLLARDLLYTVTPSPDRISLESQWVEHLKTSPDKVQSDASSQDQAQECNVLFITEGCRHSPFTQHFFELIFSPWSKVNAFPLFHEAVSFDIDGLALRLIGLPAGGYISATLWVCEIGSAEIAERIIIADNIYTEKVSDFHGRISQAFNPLNLASLVRSQISCCILSTSARSTSSKAPKVLYDEGEAAKLISETCLNSVSNVLLPLDIKEAVSVLLLLHLMWMNLPALREKVSIAVVSPVAKQMATTTRLLLESMNAQIREAFVTHKVNLIGALLDGLTTKSSGAPSRGQSHSSHSKMQCYYYEDMETMRLAHERNLDSVLILASPFSMDYGPSKDCFTELIGQKKSGAVLFIRSPSKNTFAHKLLEASLARHLPSQVEGSVDYLKYFTVPKDDLAVNERLNEMRVAYSGVVDSVLQSADMQMELRKTNTELSSTAILASTSPTHSSDSALNLNTVMEDSRRHLESAIFNFFNNKQRDLQFDDTITATVDLSARVNAALSFQMHYFTDNLSQYVQMENSVIQLELRKITIPFQCQIVTLSDCPELQNEDIYNRALCFRQMLDTIQPRQVIDMAACDSGQIILPRGHLKATIGNFDDFKKLIQSNSFTVLQRMSRFQQEWRRLPDNLQRELTSSFAIGDVIISRKAPQLMESQERPAPELETKSTDPPTAAKALSNPLLLALQNISQVLKQKAAPKEVVSAVLTNTHLQATEEKQKSDETSDNIYITGVTDIDTIYRAQDLSLADVKRQYINILGSPIDDRVQINKTRGEGGSQWQVSGKLSLGSVLLKHLLVHPA